MRCENAGSDYDENNIQWTCKADVPDFFKLGASDVICEGYASSEDPYVLKGSCGVEYRLLLTEKGEAKYGKDHSPKDDPEVEGSSWVPTIFWILFAGVVVWMIYSAYKNMGGGRQTPPTHRPGNNGGGGPGPGNDDDDDDAPPPYTPYADHPPSKGKPTSKPTSSRQPNRGSSSQGSSSRWQPGFGTGAAAGAAAGAAGGYMYGQRERNQLEADLQYEREQRRRDADLQRQEDARQQRELRDERARRARDALRRDSDSSSGSTKFHSTTGFGETRRR
jgi:hypothetical protein